METLFMMNYNRLSPKNAIKTIEKMAVDKNFAFLPHFR